MRSLLVLVPAFALSLGVFACSGADGTDVNDSNTGHVTDGLVDEGQDCDAEHQCKAGLVCVARVAGGDLATKGVVCGGPGCGGSTSSGGTTSSTSSGGWSGSSTSSGGTTSSTSSGGWSSSTSSGGWSSSSGTIGTSSSSSGGALEQGVCISIH